ncbi:MAG: Hsp20/alpha crystallin family protein [Acidiferrobacterales bacterium]
MNMLIRNPQRERLTRGFGDDFDNLFEGFFRPLRWQEEPVNEGLVPRLDVVENDNEFIVHAELPGVKKEDIHITLEDSVLTLDAESKSETEEKEGSRVVRQERRYGKYVRSMRLGKEVDGKKVKANYKDGILELTLPKAEEVKPKKINVDVS